MSYHRTSEILLGSALSLAVLTGCGETYKEPVATAPNDTLEQVEHNLDYAATLGKLTQTQEIDLYGTHGDSIRLYNFTDRPVDEATFGRIVTYFGTLGDQLPRVEKPLVLHPFDDKTGKMTNKQATASLIPRYDAEHDFVLVPNDTKMPTIRRQRFRGHYKYGYGYIRDRFYSAVGRGIRQHTSCNRLIISRA